MQFGYVRYHYGVGLCIFLQKRTVEAAGWRLLTSVIPYFDLSFFGNKLAQ